MYPVELSPTMLVIPTTLVIVLLATYQYYPSLLFFLKYSLPPRQKPGNLEKLVKNKKIANLFCRDGRPSQWKRFAIFLFLTNFSTFPGFCTLTSLVLNVQVDSNFEFHFSKLPFSSSPARGSLAFHESIRLAQLDISEILFEFVARKLFHLFEFQNFFRELSDRFFQHYHVGTSFFLNFIFKWILWKKNQRITRQKMTVH